MRLLTMDIKNFRNFSSNSDGSPLKIELDGKSTVFYGINGAGKTTVLSAICYAAWPFINRLNNAQGTGYRTLDGEQLHIGHRVGNSRQFGIEIQLQFENEKQIFTLSKEMERFGNGRVSPVNSSRQNKQITELVKFFNEHYLEEDDSEISGSCQQNGP